MIFFRVLLVALMVVSLELTVVQLSMMLLDYLNMLDIYAGFDLSSIYGLNLFFMSII